MLQQPISYHIPRNDHTMAWHGRTAVVSGWRRPGIFLPRMVGKFRERCSPQVHFFSHISSPDHPIDKFWIPLPKSLLFSSIFSHGIYTLNEPQGTAWCRVGCEGFSTFRSSHNCRGRKVLRTFPRLSATGLYKGVSSTARLPVFLGHQLNTANQVTVV